MDRKLVFDKEGLEAFASQLKKIRKERSMTQEELSFRCGIALSQIARIETSRINPTLSTIFKIARCLDLPLNKLFDFELPDKEVG